MSATPAEGSATLNAENVEKRRHGEGVGGLDRIDKIDRIVEAGASNPPNPVNPVNPVKGTPCLSNSVTSALSAVGLSLTSRRATNADDGLSPRERIFILKPCACGGFAIICGMEKKIEFPGFVDVHVHFRDPGVPEAETTATGLAAARHGGFAAVVTMPNTTPACDSVAVMDYQRHAAADVARRGYAAELPLLFTSACLTKGRLGQEVADLEALAASGAAFFTDDGSYVVETKVMEEAMRRAAALGLVVSQHALAPGLSEADCIRRDLSLCRETGCRLHVQHISTAAGVALVRDAQREGLPVTAEATPHHVLLCRDDIVGDDGNFKMAPPLATREDRAEVRRGVKDGVLMFATDHAPHPAAKKNCGYAKAANGIIGLETAIPITYHVMVEEEGMPVEKWAEAWWKLPRAILPPALAAQLEGRTTRIDVGKPHTVDCATFASRSRNCPYRGMVFDGWSHNG